MNCVPLVDIADIIMGQSPPSSSYNKEKRGLPFFQGKADFGEIYPSIRYYCDEPSKVAKKGDILISVRAPVGPTNIANTTSCIGRGLAAIRPHNKLDSWYLLYFLRFSESEIAEIGRGSTFESISREDIETISIPLPPLPEQQRIAAILQKVDRVRRLRRYARSLSEGYLQSVFLEMFGDPVRNTKKYSLVEFQEICDTKLGKMLDAKQQTGKHKRPYLRNENVQWMHIDVADLKYMDFDEDDRSMFRLEYGDILICEGGEVGRCAIWKNQLAECYYQKALHRARVYPNKVHPEYIVWLLFCLAKLGGLGDFTSQVTIAHLTAEKLKTILVPLPCLEEQSKFVDIVHKFEKYRNKQIESYRQAEHLFQSVLAQAFRGEL